MTNASSRDQAGVEGLGTPMVCAREEEIGGLAWDTSLSWSDVSVDGSQATSGNPVDHSNARHIEDASIRGHDHAVEI
jgi:hypothetical protein